MRATWRQLPVWPYPPAPKSSVTFRADWNQTMRNLEQEIERIKGRDVLIGVVADDSQFMFVGGAGVTATYDRTTVARPPDANFGPIRARRPEAVIEMRRLRAGNVRVATIAEQFGISKRTAYRYLEGGIRYFEVNVDGWHAIFARSPRRAPWRVGAWERRA